MDRQGLSKEMLRFSMSVITVFLRNYNHNRNQIGLIAKYQMTINNDVIQQGHKRYRKGNLLLKILLCYTNWKGLSALCHLHMHPYPAYRWKRSVESLHGSCTTIQILKMNIKQVMMHIKNVAYKDQRVSLWTIMTLDP